MKHEPLRTQRLKFSANDYMLQATSYMGFTLIEVIIVVAILAILGAFSFTFVSQSGQGEFALQASKDSMVSLLKTSRQRAMVSQSNSSWGVHFDNTGGTGFFTIYSNTYSSTSTNARFYLNQQTSFQTPASGQGLNVKFDQITGNLSSGSASEIIIILKGNSARGKRITINQFGAINSYDLETGAVSLKNPLVYNF